MKKLNALFILCAAFTITVNAQSLTIQLSGTNITCYNARNGSVNLTVSGGTSPYTFQWSNGATTEDINTLPPSYYAVTVTDAASNTATNGVTITEPAQIIYQFATSDYIVNGTHYNLSSYTWHNGIISTNVSGGVAPYTYLWSNSATTANISSLDAGSYRVTITDATSCSVLSDGIALTKPDRSDWTMSGNANTTPGTQFIGTTDNKDFIFKTNNTEALRIKTNGDIKFPSLAGNGISNLYVDNNGILKGIITPNCSGIGVIPAWSNDTLNLFTNCDWVNVGIGTTTPSQKLEVQHTDQFGGIAINQNSNTYYTSEIKFNYQGIQKWALGCNLGNISTQSFFIWDHVAAKNRFYIDGSGKIFIGDFTTNPPCNSCTSTLYKLYVEGGIVARDVKVTAATSFPDYVFNPGYPLMGIYELEQFIKLNRHLPGIPTAKEIEKNEGYEVGDMVQKLLEKTEEQSLYIISLQKQIDVQNEKIEKLSKR